MPAATPADPVPSQRRQPHPSMLPKLTFTDGSYNVPKEWVNWDWINNIENYPDPEHLVFEGEYDWNYRQGNGVLGRYIRHVSGFKYQRISKSGKRSDVNSQPKPYIYYMFALAAIELIENPRLYRDAHVGALNGQFVVNYANGIEVENLKWVPEKAGKRKKHVVPACYGALLSRVFNETSGVKADDKLKLEEREPKKCLCPYCKAVFEHVTRLIYLPGDKGYDEARKKLGSQIEYRLHRDLVG